MTDYGFWSVLPPLVAIVLAIRTRQVFISLGVGILLGWIIIESWNPLKGAFSTANAIVDVFKNEGSTQTVIFTLLIGSLIAFIQRSGGVNGFINYIGKKLEKNPASSRKVQLWAALTGILVFVESNISALTVGTLYRPLTDSLKISREKLAYLADSTSAPSSIIIPLNAWGGFIMGLLILQGMDKPFISLVKAIPFNFYPLLALAMVFYIILSGKDFGPMRKAEERARKEGKPLRDGATPTVSTEITFLEAMPGKAERAHNMIIPIAVMVLSMPFFLVMTGWKQADPADGFFVRISEAIGNSSGSASVLYSVLTSLLVTITLYSFQNIFKLKELMDTALTGLSGMTGMALLMVLAFAIGNLCNALGTGLYVARITQTWLSPSLMPFVIFVTSCFIAFSTGTSWGTFAIMIAIAVPVAQTVDANMSLAIAAVLGGGVFGDHCSPISDTTLISSMASASDHIDHVKTQIPYALTAGAVTAIIYLILGALMSG
ncbi:MAG: Na+/H+ antiporter NhaC family protein [Marinilabiliaceae bacterium]|jgi:Na+/H+ antiporter NhaC|nr:Na+/H+ antiporter NhaC family protein [Marinilabiliaceae bacterium]